jgi:hypothetical protein
VGVNEPATGVAVVDAIGEFDELGVIILDEL